MSASQLNKERVSPYLRYTSHSTCSHESQSCDRVIILRQGQADEWETYRRQTGIQTGEACLETSSQVRILYKLSRSWDGGAPIGKMGI